MPTCPNCTSEVAESASYCPLCGAALPTREERAHEADPDVDARTEPRSEETLRKGQTPDRGREPTIQQGETSTTKLLHGRLWLTGIIGGIVGFTVASGLATVIFPSYFVGIIIGAMIAAMFYGAGAGGGAKVGAIAGVVATIPFVLLVFLLVVLGAGWLTAAGVPATQGPDVLAGLGLMAALLSIVGLAVNVVCGIFGGILGSLFVDS